MPNTPFIVFTVNFLCFRRGKLATGNNQLLDNAVGQAQMRQAALCTIRHPLYTSPTRVFACPDPASVQSAAFFLAEVISHSHPVIDTEHPALDLCGLTEFERRHITGLEAKDDDRPADRQETIKELISSFPLCRELRGQFNTGLLTTAKQIVEEAQSQLTFGQTLRDLPTKQRTRCVLIFGSSPLIDLGGPEPEKTRKLLPGGGVAYTVVMEAQVQNDRSQTWSHRCRVAKAEHLPLR